MAENTPEFSIEALEEFKKLIQNISKILIEQGIDQVKEPVKEIVPYLSTSFRDALPAEALKEVFELVDPFIDTVTTVLSPITDAGFDLIFQPLDVDEDNPYAAMESIQKALLRVVIVLGIVAFIPELVHPLKELGLGRITPAIVEIGGFNTIASSISSILVERTANAPLRYALNRKLTPYIPGQQDLIRFTVREDLGYEWLSPFLARLGYNEEWAKHYWDSHWELVGISSLYQMFHRGIINEQILTTMLVRHDFNRTDEIEGVGTVNWPEKLRDLSYNLIPRVDLRYAWEAGLIDDDELFRRMKLLGYSDEDAQIETIIQKQRTLTAEINEERREVLKDYREGLLSVRVTRERLQTFGDTDESIGFRLRAAEYFRERDHKQDLIKEVISALNKGNITPDETKTRLIEYGIQEWRINNILELVKLEQDLQPEE